MKSTKTRPPQDAGLKICKVRLELSLLIVWKQGKVFPYSSIVNSEKLVCPGSHVNVVRFSFGPFLVHEGVNRVIRRRAFDQPVHNLKKGLSQGWRAFLRCTHALLGALSGIVFSGVNTCKSGQCPTMCKACYIPNLSHELGSKGRTDAVHCHHNWIFR